MRLLSLLITLALSAEGTELTGSVRLATNPVTHAIVYLGAGNGRVAVTNVVLEVRDGVLQPHVQVARQGSTLVLCNTDPTLHVMRVDALNATNTGTRLLTQAMPYAGFLKAFGLDGFRDTGLLRVTGGNGEEMSAYIAVLPHPWAALTDANGRFVLNGVPAGTYKLYVWHETLGTLVREVKVPATVDLEFTSTAPKRAD